MTRKHKHHNASAQKEAPEGPQKKVPPSYDLDEHDEFTVPYVGKFKLNFKERRVELDPWHGPPGGTIAERMAQATSRPDIIAERMAQAASRPDFIAVKVFEKAMAPDAPYGFVKRFENMEELHAHVPKIAELSRNMQALGEAKPRFVFGVGVKDHEDAGRKVDVESALRGHDVEAHVVMMPNAAGGGTL